MLRNVRKALSRTGLPTKCYPHPPHGCHNLMVSVPPWVVSNKYHIAHGRSGDREERKPTRVDVY
eukprot:5771144-Pyramimonas_sp.AAC.3